MNSSRLIVLAVALVATVLVALYVRNLVSQPAPVVQEGEIAEVQVKPDMQVLTVARDVRAGERMLPEDFAWRAWPAAGVTKAFFTEASYPDAIGDYAGAVARVPMFTGEPVIGGKLVKPGDAGFMAAILQPGLRAVSVSVTAESGASGFILPGDRVDVILTYEQEMDEGANSRSVYTSRTILENVRVLAIDQTPVAEGDEQAIVGSTATLELSPEEAEALALAEALGDLVLSLRAVADVAGGLPGEGQRPRADTSFAQAVSNTVTVVRNGVATQITTGGN